LASPERERYRGKETQFKEEREEGFGQASGLEFGQEVHRPEGQEGFQVDARAKGCRDLLGQETLEEDLSQENAGQEVQGQESFLEEVGVAEGFGQSP
jgi:hypothetical protein